MDAESLSTDLPSPKAFRLRQRVQCIRLDLEMGTFATEAEKAAAEAEAAAIDAEITHLEAL